MLNRLRKWSLVSGLVKLIHLTLYSTLTSTSLGTFLLVFFCVTPKGALCIWMGQRRIEATCRNGLTVNCAVYMTTPWRGCVWSVIRESMRTHLFPCLHMTGHAGIFLVVAVSMGTSALLVCFLCKRSLSLHSRICRARSKKQNYRAASQRESAIGFFI